MPVSYIARISARGVMISASVGKSGPFMCSHSSAMLASGSSSRWMQALDDLAQVVRRNVGRHADRDAGRAVEQHVRQARRQQRRFLQRAVEVRRPVDRALVELGRAAPRRSASASTRCSASPRTTSDRPASRSCPGRRSADSDTRTAAPSAPSPRSRRCRRADGTCRSRRRRCAPTSSASPSRASPSSLIA